MANANHETYINNIKGKTKIVANSHAFIPMIVIIGFAVCLTLSIAGFIVKKNAPKEKNQWEKEPP